MDRIKAIKKRLNKKIDCDVILFGSRARGDFYPDSDWDIAIISPEFEGMNWLERREYVSPIIRDELHKESVDIVTYTPEEYEKGKKAYLPYFIEKEGIKV